MRFTHCCDVPHILHCHVNPSNLRLFCRGLRRDIFAVVDALGTFTYSIDHADNAVLMDVFASGAHGGGCLGPAGYGQIENFDLDCVAVGIQESGYSKFNCNWQITHGSIIANTGGDRADALQPIIIDGDGMPPSATPKPSRAPMPPSPPAIISTTFFSSAVGNVTPSALRMATCATTPPPVRSP